MPTPLQFELKHSSFSKTRAYLCLISSSWCSSHLANFSSFRCGSGVTSPAAVALSHPYSVSRRNSRVLWADNGTFQSFTRSVQELQIFISSQAHKLACQFHAGRRQESPGLETMTSLITAQQATQDLRSDWFSLFLSPKLWRQRAQADTEQAVESGVQRIWIYWWPQSKPDNFSPWGKLCLYTGQ